MSQHASLSGADIHTIVTLAHRCTEADGIEPFNEQTMLGLRKPPAPQRTHLVAADGDVITGYAQLVVDGGVAEAELAVDPDHRRRGIGRALLREAVAAAGAQARQLRVWAHGDRPPAAAFAAAEGFDRDRVLFKLGRDLAGFSWPASWPADAPSNWPVGAGAAATLGDGVVLRPFMVGDEAEWLRVNAAAFADHPEQGRWTAEDLRDREAEPWFDPAGLLIAADADGMLGFHWTKVEDGVGEIYVLGVDPRAQGTGLGKVLTLAGLAHLAAQGVDEVALYTDESNARAVALYRSQGFAVVRSDVQWGKALG